MVGSGLICYTFIMTTEQVAVAAQIKEKLLASKRVLLHCHPNPDEDSVGSALAMKYMLESLGIAADVTRGDSPLPQQLSTLPGYSSILDKAVHECDFSLYDTFLALDSSNLAYVTQKKDFSFPPQIQVFVIDHHKSNTKYGSLNLIADEYPATAQILYDLTTLWGVALTHDIALNLFIGIYSDTGGLRYPRTTGNTYRAAATLVGCAPHSLDTLRAIYNSETPGSIRFRGLGLSSLETFCDGRVVVSAVSQEALSREGVAFADTQKFSIAGMLVTVLGWDICASLVENAEGSVRVSLRSRDPERYDVSLVTSALGGGGHAAAAGAMIDAPLAEAKRIVVEKIQTVLCA